MPESHSSLWGAGAGRAVGALGGPFRVRGLWGWMVLQSPQAGWGGPCPTRGEHEGGVTSTLARDF